MHHANLLLVALLALPAAHGAADPETLPPVPGLEEDSALRLGLANCRLRFVREKVGAVTFLGGSITQGGAWRQHVCDELTRRFAMTKFTFVNAGISSVDSSGHAFRFQRDVVAKGVPDLLFVEAAVNDLHNQRRSDEQRLAMEGILRQARRANPLLDVVCLHFADTPHTADYDRGRTPEIIANHEAIAAHYGAPSVNLAHEVQRRIAAGQMDWRRDFRGVHPSAWGHRLYAQAVRRLFDQAWARPVAPEDQPRAHAVPPPLSTACYDGGRLAPLAAATDLRDCRIVDRWRPGDRAGTRSEFVNVPALVGETPGAGFALDFDGRAVGLFLTAGPDAGIIEFRIDGGAWQRRVTFTQWSGGLHLPWVLVLRNDLAPGPHRLDLRLTAERNPLAKGTALRVQHLLVNGPVG